MEEKKELNIQENSRLDTAIAVASIISSAIPWIGGPVSNVLSGMSYGRKLARVKEILLQLINDLHNFKSDISKVCTYR